MEEKKESEPVIITEDKKPTHENLPRLRTMKYDAARYLKDRDVSFLDLVTKEQERARERTAEFEFQERIGEKAWFRGVLALTILVFLGVMGYGVYVYIATRNTLPDANTTLTEAFISVEEREILSVREGDRAGLLQKLEASRRDRLPSRSIKHVIIRLEPFAKSIRPATAKDFFETLDFKPPAGLTENVSDKFDMFIYYRTDGADAALILESKDYERLLAHMLSWESTILLDFKYLYFDSEVSQPSQLFSDVLVRNVDTRTVSLGNDLTFSYAFFARKLLVISTSKEFLEILIGRLLASPPR